MKIPENLSSARASAAYPERKQGRASIALPFHLSVCEPEKAVTFPDGLLFVIKLLCLILRLAGQVHAQFFQSVFVHLREYHAGVHLAAAEQPELFERERSDGIRSRAY